MALAQPKCGSLDLRRIGGKLGFASNRVAHAGR
jgi:hypothetical protein